MSQNMVKNYLIETCFFCKNEMVLTEGAIICGDKWYHKNCFNESKSAKTLCLIEKFEQKMSTGKETNIVISLPVMPKNINSIIIPYYNKKTGRPVCQKEAS